MHGRYKTAFIVINNYKGYDIVIRKYIESVLRFAMDIKFYEFNNNGEKRVYNIESANNLIKLFETNQLSDVQKKLIKPINNDLCGAQPYIVKKQKKVAQIKNVVLHLYC